jgi:threonine/homoserine/homoserine lactone efflux protein
MPDLFGLFTPEAILPFLMAVALIELTPGPNMGWLALVAATRGRTAGLAAVAGTAVGLAAWMLAAVMGLTALLAEWPMAYQTVRWAGVAYLFWLAWEALKGDTTTPGDAEVIAGARRRALFLRGLTANLLNPKAAVFYTAVLPAFIRPEAGSATAQALTLGTIQVLVATAVHAGIVLGADRAGQSMLARLEGRTVRIVMAAGIALIAVWVAWTTRG